MTTKPMNRVVRRLLATCGREGMTDGELLTRFLSGREDAALSALVRRHGPMVWGVCCRLLRNHHDAEDAFQATFLVLVQKGATLPDRETVGNWLYGVAHKTAVRMRAIAAKRGMREKQATIVPEPATPEQYVWSDLAPVLDEELRRLPDKFRVLIVLCDLEGVARKEVARQLGIPEGTAASRLATARDMLAKRLTRRGMAVSGVLAGSVLSQQSAWASTPPAVTAATIKAATLAAAGHAASGVLSPTAATLTRGVTKAMFATKIKTKMAGLLTGLLLVGGAIVTAGRFAEEAAMAQSDVAEQKAQAEKKAKAEAAKAEAQATALGKETAKFSLICLGATKDSIITKYGKPEKSVTFQSGIESLHFQHSPDLRMLVEISPKTGKAIQIYYRKKTPFTNPDIGELLDLNAEGSRWQVERLSDVGGVFRRLDGGLARGGEGKIGEEYQFAILSGSELRGKNP